MLIGAHVAARGGLHNAVDNALAIGAEVIQTHPTPAQMWRPLRLEEADRQLYLQKYAAAGLRGHYLHAVYLINLASPKPELLRSSVASLVHYMEVAAALDAEGVVFHPGSHLGAGFESVLAQVGGAIREVIDRSPPRRARLLVENSAGSGGCVGSELRGGRPRGRGRRLRPGRASASTPSTPSRAGTSCAIRRGRPGPWTEFGRLIGFERLGLVHANDSARALGSNADRHANLGEGEIGDGRLPAPARDPRLRRVPWVLEVPGHERKGPDRQQVSLLRELAGRQPRWPSRRRALSGAARLEAASSRGPVPSRAQPLPRRELDQRDQHQQPATDPEAEIGPAGDRRRPAAEMAGEDPGPGGGASATSRTPATRASTPLAAGARAGPRRSAPPPRGWPDRRAGPGAGRRGWPGRRPGCAQARRVDGGSPPVARVRPL